MQNQTYSISLVASAAGDKTVIQHGRQETAGLSWLENDKHKKAFFCKCSISVYLLYVQNIPQ